MKIGDKVVSVKQVEIGIGKKILLAILSVTGLSVILAAMLAYIFSDNFITIMCSVIFAITLGILVNYILLISKNIITRVNVDLTCEEKKEQEYHTVMKIE